MSQRFRKRSLSHLANRIVRSILSHPNNQKLPIQALTRAVLWQLRKRISPKPVLVRHRELWSMELHPDSNAASNVVYFGLLHDRKEMEFLCRVVKDGDWVVDVGANIGTYSLLLARLVGPTGRVIAIEPEPRAVTRLRRNLALNAFDHVEVHEVGVSNEEGRVAFNADIDVSNAVLTDETAAILRASGRLVREIIVQPLAAILGPSPIWFLKLDVEGLELQALEGLEPVSELPAVIILELFPNTLRPHGATIADVKAWLLARDYVEVDEVGSPVKTTTGPNHIYVRADRIEELRDRIIGSTSHIDSDVFGRSHPTFKELASRCSGWVKGKAVG